MGDDHTETMQGDELASKLKSSAVFKSANSVKASQLKLAPADMAWWRDAKFGMFIHWGLYAIPARGDWVMHNEKIPADDYAKLADRFVPKQLDADKWAEIAKDAGMRYMVLTARHHDGFALWNSPSSDREFCSSKTSAKRDFVAEYVKACRRAKLGVGLYYSPMDWRFPGYFKPEELADNAALMKKQGYGQVEELMRNYGKIDILWYDGGWLAHQGTDADAAWFWDPVKLNTMVRKYQPTIVINPRSGWEGDFECDEGGHEIGGPVIDVPWEKCLNLNQASWGYSTKQNLMLPEEVIGMLVNVVGRGGNVLLNVGPDADGAIPPAHVETLKKVGEWLRHNGKSIFGTRPGPFQPVDGRYCSTSKGTTIYLHVFDWGSHGVLTLSAPGLRIKSSSLLSGDALSCVQTDTRIELAMADKQGTGLPDVVELVLDGMCCPSEIEVPDADV